MILVASKISDALSFVTLKQQLVTGFHRIFSSLLQVILPAAFGAEISRWEAGNSPPNKGLQLEGSAASEWRLEKTEICDVARLKPSTDYYSRAAYHVMLTALASPKFWLVIEFLDRGYGIITVSPGVSQTRQWGIARVNSGAIRRAVFQYDRQPATNRFSIEGLDYLRAVAKAEADWLRGLILEIESGELPWLTEELISKRNPQLAKD